MLAGDVKYLRYRETVARSETGAVPWSSGDDCLAFSNLRGGNWNVGELDWDESVGKYTLGAVDKEQLRSLEPWHSTRIDWRDLPEILIPSMTDHPQIHGHIYAHVRKPCLGSGPTLINYEWHPEVGIEIEVLSKFYSTVHSHGITPKFLAHVTENHERIIGYAMEFIPNTRNATANDLHACKTVLQRLHSLGWTLGVAPRDIISFFYISEDGSAFVDPTLMAYRTEDTEVFGKEMKDLEAAFN